MIEFESFDGSIDTVERIDGFDVGIALITKEAYGLPSARYVKKGEPDPNWIQYLVVVHFNDGDAGYQLKEFYMLDKGGLVQVPSDIVKNLVAGTEDEKYIEEREGRVFFMNGGGVATRFIDTNAKAISVALKYRDRVWNSKDANRVVDLMNEAIRVSLETRDDGKLNERIKDCEERKNSAHETITYNESQYSKVCDDIRKSMEIFEKYDITPIDKGNGM